MKVSRRTGLGAILGGLFAGPTAAKQMMEQGTTFDKVIGYTGAATPSKAEMAKLMKDKLAGELAHVNQLRKTANNTLSGNFSEWQLNRLRDTGRTRDDIASLKSVTKATKSRMWEKHQKQKMKEHWILEAKNTLLRFLYWKPGQSTYNESDGPQAAQQYDSPNGDF